MLERYLEAEVDEPLVWVMAPDLLRMVTAWNLESVSLDAHSRKLVSRGDELARYRKAVRPTEALAASARRLAPGPYAVELREYEKALFVTVTLNQRRTIDPILEAYAGRSRERVPQLSSRSPRPALRQLQRNGMAAADRFLNFVLNHGIPVDPVRAYRSFQAAARMLALAESLVGQSSRFDAVVLANQHSPSLRAFCRAARTAEVPVVYIPHAPVANNEDYKDLPVDYAGLRGQGEIDFYARLGVAEDDLAVVGSPMVSDFAPPTLHEDAPPVVALSAPWPISKTRETLELVREAVEGPVIVVPHPLSDVRELKRMRYPDWIVQREGRAIDALLKGPPYLVQRSSGVAWEALHLGIPTIQIALEESNYPVVSEPHVAFATTPLALAEAARKARIAAQDLEERESLRSWAHHWCALTGANAAQLGADLVREAVVKGPRPEALLDRVGSIGRMQL